MNAAADSGCIEREMGLDHADFWRLLPRAAGAHRWQADGDRVCIEVAGGRIEIELGSQRTRRIAQLALPVTPVTLTWHGVEAEAFRRFLAAFDREYQRGGG
jgi:hypothetical protein